VGSVYIEVREKYYNEGPEWLHPVGETEFVAGLNDSMLPNEQRLCQGIIGYADLEVGNKVADVLDAHMEAGKGKFKGIRRGVYWSSDPAVYDDGWLYVADRENHRVQVFNTDGKYETQWNNLHRPCGLYMPRGKCPHCFVGELGPGMAVNRYYRNLGPRISILNNEGELIARLGGEDGPGLEIGQFMAPHGLAVDSHEHIYVRTD
jgi:hypothetical protein